MDGANDGIYVFTLIEYCCILLMSHLVFEI